jgi:hypothetical protein
MEKRKTTAPQKIHKGLIENQELADSLAVSLSAILGSSVVKKSDYDKLNKEKQILLGKTRDIDLLRRSLLTTQCKLNSFIGYHSQWKNTTRKFEVRLQKLKNENLYLTFNEFPFEISENLKEAYNCYLNGLSISSYIMILRTIEISIGIIYDKHNEIQFDKEMKQIFIPAIKKLNWAKSNKFIEGADFRIAKGFIEARNDAVHEMFVPTDLQILSAFQTVVNFLNKCKTHL